MKQAEPEPTELVTLSVRVTRQLADDLKAVADAEFRPVAAQMRRLIQTCVDEHAATREQAA